MGEFLQFLKRSDVAINAFQKQGLIIFMLMPIMPEMRSFQILSLTEHLVNRS